MTIKTKTAKQCLRAYRAFRLWWIITPIVVFGVCTWLLYPVGAGYFLFVVLSTILLSIGANLFSYQKWILSALTKDLDSSLYYEIVKTGKFYNHLAFGHLEAEFHAGNYNNAAAICYQKLADPKIAKKFSFVYLSFLANMYFRTGDDVRLGEVCERVDALMAEQKKISKSIKNWIVVIPFFQAYLRRDLATCEAFWNNNPSKLELGQVTRNYNVARVALAVGETEKAKALFEEVLQKAPKLYLSTHAAHALEAIEASCSYDEGIEPITPTENFVLPVAPQKSKVVTVLLWVIIMCLFLGSVYLKWQEKQWDREYEEYIEEIRLIVEEDYDNVAVVQTFDPLYDDIIVDNMFVCEVDSGMILGAVYVYEDEYNLCYDIFVTIDKEELQSEEKLCLVSEFESATCYINIVMGFYSKVEDVPEDAWEIYYATPHGRPVYIALISMEEIPH